MTRDVPKRPSNVMARASSRWAATGSLNCPLGFNRKGPLSAEAWYNLADLLLAQGPCWLRLTYIDAMFNLALLLQRKSAYAEAADFWRRYLQSDRASEWAARARRALKFSEIQANSLASRPLMLSALGEYRERSIAAAGR